MMCRCTMVWYIKKRKQQYFTDVLLLPLFNIFIIESGDLNLLMKSGACVLLIGLFVK